MTKAARQNRKQPTRPKKRKIDYPRAGKGRVRRWLPSWRVVVGSFMLLFALGIGMFFGLYVSTTVPEPADFAIAQTTTVYYDDGKTELGTLSDVNRSVIPAEQIPAVMKNAVVASEDRSFYQNNGISPKGIIRALWNNLTGGSRQGGSTLTQQYAERYYLGTTTSLFGKAREAILALKIDQSQSKEEILANYLNTIYFGRGAYGIEAAAQAYFGVPAKDLTLEQAALLTAVIPAPSAWDPAVNPEKARQRYTRVLKLMAEDEWIKPAERDQALAIFPDTIKQKTANTLAGTNGYLLQTVKAELLNQAGFTEDQVANGGYKIVSTFNKEKQDLLVQAVNALPQDRPANNRVGAYSMNPQNGEVYALYGGKDYLVQQQNDATQSRAQAGSTFKIFTLVGAIEKDVPMHQKFPAPGTMRVPGTDLEFSNDSLINYGALDLVGMTRTSANTPYINLNLEIGASTTAETAVKMGIPQDAPGLDANIGNVLGSTSVTAKQMAQAYGVVAAGGKLHQAHTVRTVENSSGANIYTGNTSGKQVIKQDTATLATHAFRSVVSSGSAVAKRIGVPKGREYAGKSGTSSGPVSGWFIGYTPQMVTAVNMFQSGENGAEEKLTPFGGVRTVYGVTFPLEIWWDYTKPALLNAERLKFPDPAKLLALQSPPPVAPKPSETEKPAEEQVEQPRGEQPGVEAPAGNSGTQSGQEGTTGNAPAPQPPADGGQPGVAGEPDPGAGVSEGE